MPERIGTSGADSEPVSAFPGTGRPGGGVEAPLLVDSLAGSPGGAAGGAAEPAAVKDKPRSLLSDAWYDLRRRPMFLLSAFLLAVLVAVAAFPNLFSSLDPTFCDLTQSRLPPGDGHLLGTNKQGCDVYARMIHGARPSILVGVLTTLGVLVVGGVLGALAGFYGGLADSLLSRITDVFFAIPLLLGAIVFLTAFPSRNILTVVLVLVVLGWPQVARIMRGAVISVREADYVLAARALGASDGRILLRHILPNSLAPVIVVATILLGIFIVTEASLSFLGIGLPPDTVSWGGDISTAQDSLRRTPRILLAPAGALSITVLSFILLGDAVREALDPRLR